MTITCHILAPLHLLSYSTLLGTSLYQTFILTKLASQSLPRPAFVRLQARIFPIYFRSQSLLLVLVALTLPPHGPASIFQAKRKWLPLAVAGVSAALNTFVYGPETGRIMLERVELGLCFGLFGRHWLTELAARDSKQGSVEMERLNRAFSRAHAMSIHLNLVAIIATLFHGGYLSAKLAGEVD